MADARTAPAGIWQQRSDVLVAIGSVPRGPGDRPVKDVVLKEVVISRGEQ